MGEYADMIIDGEVCQLCGVFLGDAPGHPRYCPDCNAQAHQKPQNKQLQCPHCERKFIHERALDAHSVAKHGTEPTTKFVRKQLAAGTIKRAEPNKE